MVIRMATTVEMEGAMMRTEVVDWISPRRTREDAKGVLVVVVVVEAVIKEEAKVETEVDMMKRVTVIERSEVEGEAGGIAVEVEVEVEVDIDIT